jgi:hypothetical protein
MEKLKSSMKIIGGVLLALFGLFFALMALVALAEAPDNKKRLAQAVYLDKPVVMSAKNNPKSANNTPPIIFIDDFNFSIRYDLYILD